MTETLSPALPDEVDAAVRGLLERACKVREGIQPFQMTFVIDLPASSELGE